MIAPKVKRLHESLLDGLWKAGWASYHLRLS